MGIWSEDRRLYMLWGSQTAFGEVVYPQAHCAEPHQIICRLLSRILRLPGDYYARDGTEGTDVV